MKTRTAASTFALIISLYGITPATAESFNERGPDIGNWPAASQTPMAQPSEQSRTTASHSQRFNKGSTFATAPASFTDPAQSRQVCDLSPRIGFNESSQISAC